MQQFSIGVIGNGSWGTALTKIITDNGQTVNWWMRNQASIDYIERRHHNPNYLHSAYFDVSKLKMSDNIQHIADTSDLLVIAVPSAYAESVLRSIDPASLKQKKILSAIKGLIPGHDILLNDFLHEQIGFSLENYFAVLGPCHAEEVAAEKLSYLTFSGIDGDTAEQIAACFQTPYINTVVNTDILGVQYAAVMKNIYALGAGIAHGLDYGDNFLSVFIANSADEMAGFLRKVGVQHIVVGEHESHDSKKDMNYAASVYLGDLLVTCYSPYSRNRTFGTMIGKGYTVKSAQLELNMVAEGYYAARCMHNYNKSVGADMPIADTVYRILWERLQPKKGFSKVEEVLV